MSYGYKNGIKSDQRRIMVGIINKIEIAKKLKADFLEINTIEFLFMKTGFDNAVSSPNEVIYVTIAETALMSATVTKPETITTKITKPMDPKFIHIITESELAAHPEVFENDAIIGGAVELTPEQYETLGLKLIELTEADLESNPKWTKLGLTAGDMVEMPLVEAAGGSEQFAGTNEAKTE